MASTCPARATRPTRPTPSSWCATSASPRDGRPHGQLRGLTGELHESCSEVPAADRTGRQPEGAPAHDHALRLRQPPGYRVVGTGNRASSPSATSPSTATAASTCCPWAVSQRPPCGPGAPPRGARRIVERAPSAGLWPGQTDEGDLGFTYDELDAYLAGERGRHADEIARLVAASAHKRAPARSRRPRERLAATHGSPVETKARRDRPPMARPAVIPVHSQAPALSVEDARMTVVVQKYGGSRWRRRAHHECRPAHRGHPRAGNSVCAVSRPAATPPTSCSPWPTRSPRGPRNASWTCCSPPASASAAPCWPWRSTPSGMRPSASPARRPASSPTRATPRQDRGHLAAPRRTGAGRRQDHPRRRLSGGHDQQGRDHAGPRRLRHHGGGPGPRPGRRRLRDLLRRRWRLHGQSGHRAQGPQAHAVSYEEMLEMAASGAQVLALRSVEYARNYNVVIQVARASQTRRAPG